MGEETEYSKPFRVRVGTDYRKNAKVKLDGQLGFCLGLYEYPFTKRKIPAGASEDDTDYNPLILTDSGHYIWGIECDWVDDPEAMNMPLEVLQDAGKLRNALIKKAISAKNN